MAMRARIRSAEVPSIDDRYEGLKASPIKNMIVVSTGRTHRGSKPIKSNHAASSLATAAQHRILNETVNLNVVRNDKLL
jgi:hypothetical protein